MATKICWIRNMPPDHPGRLAAPVNPRRGGLASHQQSRMTTECAWLVLGSEKQNSKSCPIQNPLTPPVQWTGDAFTTGDHLPLWLSMASSTFDSLCRVLFTIRSLYLCTIGLAIVFSLDRDTPAIIELQYKEALLIGHQPLGL